MSSKQHTPDSFFAELSCPEGDFESQRGFESRHYPLWCAECNAWHLVYYSLHLGRRRGKRFVEAWAMKLGDADGELADAWRERDGEKKFAELVDRYYGDTFVTMTNRAYWVYYDWVIETQRDPLNLSGGTKKRAYSAWMTAANKSKLTHPASSH